MCAGAYLPVKVTQVAGSNGSSHGQQLSLQLPSGLGRGLVQIEIARSGYISQAVVNKTCHFVCQHVSSLCKLFAWLPLYPCVSL